MRNDMHRLNLFRPASLLTKNTVPPFKTTLSFWNTQVMIFSSTQVKNENEKGSVNEKT